MTTKVTINFKQVQYPENNTSSEQLITDWVNTLELAEGRHTLHQIGAHESDRVLNLLIEYDWEYLFDALKDLEVYTEQFVIEPDYEKGAQYNIDRLREPFIENIHISPIYVTHEQEDSGHQSTETEGTYLMSE